MLILLKLLDIPGGKGGRVSFACALEPPCKTLFDVPAAAELFVSL